MSKMFTLPRACLVGATLLAMTAPALADPLTVTSAIGGVAGSFMPYDLSAIVASPTPYYGVSISFAGTAGLVSGNVSDVYAAPYVSGYETSWIAQPAGPVTGDYLTAGSTGAESNSAVTINFTTPQSVFAMLWGSVDNYNNVLVYDGSTLLGTVNGSAVNAEDDGDQGINGTDFVEINSTTQFTSLVFTSSDYAFEFIPVDVDSSTVTQTLGNPPLQPTSVPEPGSLLLLGAGLGALAIMRRGKFGNLPRLPA